MKKSVKGNHKIYYLITLDDDRWYFPKHRWWYLVDSGEILDRITGSRRVKTIKKVYKILRRLRHEGYEGKVFVRQHFNYIPDKGHMSIEHIYTL